MDNLLSTDNERGDLTVYTYDALNRPISEALPAAVSGTEATTHFVYDAAGDLLERQMPGGTKQVMTYDTAGRQATEELHSPGGAVTRHYDYGYYPGTSPYAGHLQSVTDPRGFSKTTTYDDWLRPATIASTGSTVPEQNQTTSYVYDRRSLLTQLTQSYTVGTTGPPTEVDRTYDAYGQMATETVSIDGTTVQQWSQSWDAVGRRTGLNWQLAAQGMGAGSSYGFGYQADGLLSSVTDASQTYSYSYGDNGLLSQRVSPWRTFTVNSRDSRGRVLTNSTTVASNTPLAETLTWRDDSKLDSYTANRAGTGTWNETRNYAYNTRGQLLSEPYNLSSGVSETLGYQFDWNSESGPGVRTQAKVSAAQLYNTANENAFLQTTGDTNLPGDGTTENLGWTYDAAGETLTRTSDTNGTQTLTWDSFGRLVKLSQRDLSGNNGYGWTAVYDGLGRRLQTTYVPVSGGAQQTAQTLALGSFYDPLVEFLEVGVAVNGTRTWKVHGPDLSGAYGGSQGMGGVEAVIDETSGVSTGLLTNEFGDIVASIATGGTVTWSTAQMGSYGVLAGSSASALDATHNLTLALAWHSRYLDPTGFYYLGARYYDPQAGRFLSADPLGHGSDMSLYAYCNGDPVNGLDPDGRFGKGWSDGYHMSSSADASNSFLYNLGRVYGANDAAIVSGVGEGSAIALNNLTLGRNAALSAYTSDLNGWAYTGSRWLSGAGEAGLAVAGGYVGAGAVVSWGQGMILSGTGAWQAFAYTGSVTYALSTPGGQNLLNFGEQAMDASLAWSTGSPVGSSSLAGNISASVVSNVERLELTGGVSMGGLSDTALLQQHLDNAVARFNAEGYTAEQAASIAENPRWAAAHRGTQIDTFFKESVSQDPALSHLVVTPRGLPAGSIGPDVFNPETQEWWDVTTPKQWNAHVQKYWLFGNGTPLLH